jgi:phosphoribosylanthranilate isomerase
MASPYSMLVQIYETSSPEEARALAELGVDHIGVLVGDGSFPREQSVDQARQILSSIPSSSRSLALLLSADVRFIAHVISELKPAIVHLGASIDLLTLSAMQKLKKQFGAITVMRSIPIVGDESVALAQSYDGIADMLLLDSYRPGDVQIGAVGVTHSWEIDKKIVESVRTPVIIAGGLGPENVRDAIRMVRPAGVDSKTKTDEDDGSHTKDLQKVKRFVLQAKFALN